MNTVATLLPSNGSEILLQKVSRVKKNFLFRAWLRSMSRQLHYATKADLVRAWDFLEICLILFQFYHLLCFLYFHVYYIYIYKISMKEVRWKIFWLDNMYKDVQLKYIRKIMILHKTINYKNFNIIFSYKALF